jgi:hypothetical protein
MLVRLAPLVCVVCRKYLLDLFPKSQEIVALLLEPYNSLCNSYMPTEPRLMDNPNKSDLLVRVTT